MERKGYRVESKQETQDSYLLASQDRSEHNSLLTNDSFVILPYVLFGRNANQAKGSPGAAYSNLLQSTLDTSISFARGEVCL